MCLSRCVDFSLFQIDFRKSAENYTKALQTEKIHERRQATSNLPKKQIQEFNARELLPNFIAL